MKKLVVFLVVLAVGAGAAYHFGLLERLGLSGLRVRLIPKDPGLLAYFTPDTQEFLLVNVTAEQHVPISKQEQEAMLRNVEKLHAKTGVDTLRDVDAIAVSAQVGVARGRFDWPRISAFLQTKGCVLTEVGGLPAALNPKDLGVVLDGHYLLAGTREGLEQALARKRQGQGLTDDSAMVKAVDAIGWKHLLVAGALEGSALTRLLQGVMELPARSVLFALAAPKEGIEMLSLADTGDAQLAEALKAKLEGLRAMALVRSTFDTSPEARGAREVLEKATLEADARGRLRGTLRIPYALVEQASSRMSDPQVQKALDDLDAALDAPGSTVPGQTPPAPGVTSPSPGGTLATPLALDWKAPVLGVLLLAFVLMTMGAPSRPGLFNVLLHPLFLLPFLLATLGVFFLRWTGHTGGALDVLAQPLPEWHQLVSFPVAQPVTLSAALPLVFALLALAAPWLRPFAAGLGMGFASFLGVKALVGTPLALVPPALLVTWYMGNAVACLVLARIAMPSRRAPAPRPGVRPGMS